jgi:hypothetical protein
MFLTERIFIPMFFRPKSVISGLVSAAFPYETGHKKTPAAGATGVSIVFDDRIQ